MTRKRIIKGKELKTAKIAIHDIAKGLHQRVSMLVPMRTSGILPPIQKKTQLFDSKSFDKINNSNTDVDIDLTEEKSICDDK